MERVTLSFGVQILKNRKLGEKNNIGAKHSAKNAWFKISRFKDILSMSTLSAYTLVYEIQGLGMTILSKSLAFSLAIYSLSAMALVDYSEAVPESQLSPKAMSEGRIQSGRNESRALIWKSDFSFSSNYESMKIESDKIGLINLNTHLQTPFNVYLDLSYWNANNKSGSQNGNPKVIIGFNWLRFGGPSDEAKLDIYGGAKLPGNSLLASSRTDKIFGAETTKRFGSFGLGLGYDMTITGAPRRNTDMSIGNINRITFSGGWMVSNDIQFELEVENFKINQSSDTNRTNYLAKSISFSTLSPKLNLMLSPAVSLEMGARFKTNKIKSDQDLRTAGLFDLHGAYSNSIFAGLGLNL